MTVHKKLMQARVELQGTQLKKSGHNKFAGYNYFELGDFLPTIQTIFNRIGLCGVVSYTAEMATLTVVDTEDGTILLITSPMAEASLKGVHPIQNLGAVETYQRRYLWMTAMEIVEHDVLDFQTGHEERPAKAAPKPVSQPAKAPVAPKKIEGKEGPWQLKVSLDFNELEQSFNEWSAIVSDATQLALDNAGSEADVMAIFRNNKNIFDKVKEDAAAYEKILAMFTKAKNQFAKEEE
jgi:hypothetical protein